jgi:hypothetical protein
MRRLSAFFGKKTNSEPDAALATTLPSDMACMEGSNPADPAGKGDAPQLPAGTPRQLAADEGSPAGVGGSNPGNPAQIDGHERRRMEQAIATLTELHQELVALQVAPPGQAAGDPADLSLGKPISEAVGKLVAQTIDEPTGQRVGEAVHKAVDDVLAQDNASTLITRRDGLFVMNVRDSIRLSGPHGPLAEEPPTDAMAKYLLAWLAAEFPATAGRWVAYPDLRDHVYPRFQAQTGLKRSLGSVLRGLNKVTKARNREYTDHRSGERKTLKEYLVPDPAAAVVELADEKRKRCA